MPTAPKLQRRTIPAGVLSTRAVPETWNPETREITLVISTGAPGKRWAWGVGEYIEELDVAGCNLERLTMAGSVLMDHEAEVENILGCIVEAAISGDVVTATAKMASRQEVAGIVQDIASGVIRSVSIGYTVEEEEVVKADGQMERRIARKWTPWEVSFVAIAFDAGAGTRSADSPQMRPEITMSDKTIQTPETPAQPTAPAAPVVDMAAIRAAETKRQIQIRAAAAKLGIAGAELEQVITSTDSYEAAAAAMLDRAAAEDAKAQTVTTHRAGATAYGSTVQDAQMRGVVDTLLQRGGLKVADDSPMHTTVRERTLSGLLRQSLEARGVSTAGMGTREMLGRSMVMARENLVTRSGDVTPHTISDFPTALEYLGRKIMMEAYATEPLLFDQFAKRRDLASLRQEKLLRIDASPTLAATPEGGSIEYGTIGDRGETYQAAKYTSGFKVKEEVIINDDVQMMVEIMAQMGSAAVATQKGLFFQLFTQNTNTGPTMSDGNAWFSTAHGNKGTAGALALDKIGELVSILLAQLRDGSTDQYVYNEARILLVPSHYKMIAQGLLNPNLIGSTAAALPDIQQLKVLADPRLGTSGNKPWYVVGQNSGLYFGYLDSVPGPRMRQVIDQEDLSVKLICDLFFACQVGDWKGVAQNPYGL